MSWNQTYKLDVISFIIIFYSFSFLSSLKLYKYSKKWTRENWWENKKLLSLSRTIKYLNKILNIIISWNLL